MVITDEIRNACAWVAERGARVRVIAAAIDPYAASLDPHPSLVADAQTAPAFTSAEREIKAAFWLTLDAINFGSGWFPTLRKRSEPTGYRTIAAGVRRRFDERGQWTAAELAELQAADLAPVLDQDPEHELLTLFAASLRDLGTHLRDDYSGSFTALIDDAHGSAVALVERLAAWDCFSDLSTYAGRDVPFLKRAQIAAADLNRAGVAEFSDLAALTLFADNLVPHVLWLDGVLWFDPMLVTRIERGELIAHDSAEEVEIRACAVVAVEMIVASARRAGRELTAAAIDETLWNRGQGSRYKSVPRHRSRTTAY